VSAQNSESIALCAGLVAAHGLSYGNASMPCRSSGKRLPARQQPRVMQFELEDRERDVRRNFECVARALL
jgi:hypothetical protein